LYITSSLIFFSPLLFFFFFYCSVHHRDLHSFPTRRSSDLVESAAVGISVDITNKLLAAVQTANAPSPHNLLVYDISTPTAPVLIDRKSTRLNSSHVAISYAVFCLKKKKTK